MKLFGNTENLWRYITKYAEVAGREGTRLSLQLFYVLKSPDTPMLDKTIIIAALAYQVLPEDLMPRDKFGLLGLLDNSITLAVAYNRVKARVTPAIKNQVDALINQWFGPEETHNRIEEKTNPGSWVDESQVPSYDTALNTLPVNPNHPVFPTSQSPEPDKRPTLSDNEVIVD